MAFWTGTMTTKDDEEEDEAFANMIVKFLDDHKDAIDTWLRESAKGGSRRGWALLAVMSFLGGIVLLTGILTYLHSLPGEAFTFLVGTVLMYLFNVIGPRIQIG